MAETILEFKNVKKYFELKQGALGKSKTVKAVDDVSFKVEKGSSFAVIGESGSGKTTMAKMIMKFEGITEGSILFNGTDISRIKEKKLLKDYHKQVQIVHQDPTSSLNPRKTLKEIIEEPLIVHDYGSAEMRLKRVQELMDVVELPRDFLNRYPHMLSGGQKQRIGIARAIALKSELLILDEPTSALDVSVQSKVINLLNQIQKEFNLTYFFITHDLALVKNFADYVIIMQLGNMVEQGTVGEIFKSPQVDYTKKLLRAIPVVTPKEEEYLRLITK